MFALSLFTNELFLGQSSHQVAYMISTISLIVANRKILRTNFCLFLKPFLTILEQPVGSLAIKHLQAHVDYSDFLI